MSSPAPNTTGSMSFKVQTHDLASVISPNPEDSFPDVLATSRLVAFMEIACAELLKPHVPEGNLSVGVNINITHTAPTPEGSNVIVKATYLGSKGKLFQFEAIAEDEGGEIGKATHDRAIVDGDRLMKGALKRTAGKIGLDLGVAKGDSRGEVSESS